MELYQYEVGKKILPPGQEGVIFDMSDNGGTLLIQLSKPTAAEKRAFKSGVSIRAVVIEDIIFILARMGTMSWMDAPYYKYLSKNLSQFPNIENGTGVTVHAMMVDSDTGILIAQKLITLDTKISEHLISAINSQPVIPDYDRRLYSVMSRYTTERLLEVSYAN